MSNNETGEFELVVGNRQLLSGFFIVVLLFAVAFAMGYVVGQNSPRIGQTGGGYGQAVPAQDARRQPLDAAPRRSAPAAAARRAPAAMHEHDRPPPARGSRRRSRPPEPAHDSRAARHRLKAGAGARPPADGTAGDLLAGAWRCSQSRMPRHGRSAQGQGFPGRAPRPGPNNLTRVLVGPTTDKQAMATRQNRAGKRRLPPDLGNSVSDPLVQIERSGCGAPRPGRGCPSGRARAARISNRCISLKSGLRELNLHTVCESARCPNIHECFHRGAATFMILGNRCTRGCGFCSVPKAIPRGTTCGSIAAEPANVARMAAEMKLRYVVITSVNRDDLADGGSRAFRRNRARGAPRAAGSARGSADAGFLRRSGAPWRACSMPVRTSSITIWRPCRGSTARVRPQADYRQSLDVLAFARRHRRGADEVRLHGGAGRDRRRSARRCCAICARQAPTWPPSASICSPRAAICRWRSTSTPEQFERYRDYGLSLGFKMVFSGPLVRSSYMADQVIAIAG